VEWSILEAHSALLILRPEREREREREREIKECCASFNSIQMNTPRN